MAGPGAMTNGWDESAAAWIADMGTRGDYGREFVLDQPMIGRVKGRGFQRALDVGCGEGRFCRMLKELGVTAVGIDPTKALVQHAKQQDPEGEYRLGIVEALEFADRSFDLVVSYLTLIDIPDVRAAITEMSRVLRPRGTLLIANLSSFITAGPPSGWVRDPGGEPRFYIEDLICVSRASKRRPGSYNAAMPHLTALIGFALVSFGMVLTPGPNMIYLISRSITQGHTAGLISLGGVALGFVFYMLCAAFGITALLFAVPYAYDALRLAGAGYLGWLAWQALKPNGRSPFQVRELSVDGPRKLFAMGFVTNLLNPKIAMLYLALLPQFIDPTQDSVLSQSLALGFTQIIISISINAMFALTAGSIALFLGARPIWLKLQRWLMGTVLAGLAVRMALETRRS
jgi:threonine/homoserine/homoserine lactone efflux protein